MTDTHKAAIVTAPHAQIQRMHPLVERGISQTTDPATLRELLSLQREWEAGEAKRAFTRALIDMKRELPHTIEKDATVDFTNRQGSRTFYRHTSIAAMMDAVMPVLTPHGFALTWHPTTVPQGSSIMVTVASRLTHADGHSEETAISAPHDTSGSKSAAQGVASTITLLSRYGALALLGIVTADMKEPGPKGSDGGGAEGDQPEGEKPKSPVVDASRNLRAVGQLGKYGKTCEDAEKFLGRKVNEWTEADLKNLEQWCKRPQKKAEEPPEPGSNG